MNILALEFSSNRRSVAVGVVSGEFQVVAAVEDEGANRSTGMELVDRALKSAALSPREISLIAVGLGPGSYAGIRSSIAIAQGWQLAHETRLLGIPSTEVMALEAQRAGWFGHVQILIDAQRGEYYQCTYSISPEGISSLSPLAIGSAPVTGPAPFKIGPGISHVISGALDLFPTAGALALLASSRSGSQRGEELEPVYLRLPNFVKASPSRFAAS